ncbi:MAG: DnaJ domain-containing protein [Gammaproteobacteria bacterium]|nr:DnaJ domain-containing protein [Gammaproteobacteria bacterium]MBU1654067.1 DnaJ domain-containing protein [Gammaproteobacteria bacterium]MBU1962308.1 DnaJ domain-containing protein [Gammaproteobacteria bacterium]
MNDPFLILGVAEQADDAAIEAAYREGIRRSPPDRDPRRFEALRNAYEKIRTRRDRLAYDLFDTTPPDIEDLLQRAAPTGAPQRPSIELFKALLKGRP